MVTWVPPASLALDKTVKALLVACRRERNKGNADVDVRLSPNGNLLKWHRRTCGFHNLARVIFPEAKGLFNSVSLYIVSNMAKDYRPLWGVLKGRRPVPLLCVHK